MKGGLVPDTREGRERIHFVTEGEASLHYCISSGLVTEAIKVGTPAVRSLVQILTDHLG